VLWETRSPTVTRPSTVTFQKPLRDHFERGQRLHHLATSSALDDLVELVPRRANLGAKANTLPFARCPRRLITSTKTTSIEHAQASRRCRLDEDRRGPPSSPSLQDEGSVEVYESHVVTTPVGPCGIRPIVTGPAWRSVLRAAFVIAFTVMTDCNLPSWEYSGDKLGTRGHKRL
jgi:hypothetical protein